MQSEGSQPRSEPAKKPSFWKIGASALLVALIVIGASFGVASLSQEEQPSVASGYAEVKVLSNSSIGLTFGVEPNEKTYRFSYKSNYNDSTGDWIEYEPQLPLDLEFETLNGLSHGHFRLAPVAGKTESMVGVEVFVSEVQNDYVRLLVKTP